MEAMKVWNTGRMEYWEESRYAFGIQHFVMRFCAMTGKGIYTDTVLN
jgi:hypothetical protein